MLICAKFSFKTITKSKMIFSHPDMRIIKSHFLVHLYQPINKPDILFFFCCYLTEKA